MTETTGNLQEALGENASLVEALAVRAECTSRAAGGGTPAGAAARAPLAGSLGTLGIVPADFVG